MTNETTRRLPNETAAQDSREPEITYRDDGKIPVGIWIVWLAYAVFAAVYVTRYAWPDFVKWIAEMHAR